MREQLNDALRHMARNSSGGSDGGNALIIDGKALVHALAGDTRDALLAVTNGLPLLAISDSSCLLVNCTHQARAKSQLSILLLIESFFDLASPAKLASFTCSLFADAPCLFRQEQ